VGGDLQKPAIGLNPNNTCIFTWSLTIIFGCQLEIQDGCNHRANLTFDPRGKGLKLFLSETTEPFDNNHGRNEPWVGLYTMCVLNPRWLPPYFNNYEFCVTNDFISIKNLKLLKEKIMLDIVMNFI
jgi:hypothetical protein